MLCAEYVIDPENEDSIDTFLVDIKAYGHTALRRVIGLHNRPFAVTIDLENAPPELIPLVDAFTFNTEDESLIVYSNEPEVLIDAFIEMAMFMRGFNTIIGSEDHWKVDVAIGAWRMVRYNVKLSLAVHDPEQQLLITPPVETVDHLDFVTFSGMVFLAGQHGAVVEFPDGADQEVIDLFQRLRRMIAAVGLDLNLKDVEIFNTRLLRAINQIETALLPHIPLIASPCSAFEDYIESPEFNMDGLLEDE